MPGSCAEADTVDMYILVIVKHPMYFALIPAGKNSVNITFFVQSSAPVIWNDLMTSIKNCPETKISTPSRMSAKENFI